MEESISTILRHNKGIETYFSRHKNLIAARHRNMFYLLDAENITVARKE
jgi:hypothetical protein